LLHNIKNIYFSHFYYPPEKLLFSKMSALPYDNGGLQIIFGNCTVWLNMPVLLVKVS